VTTRAERAAQTRVNQRARRRKREREIEEKYQARSFRWLPRLHKDDLATYTFSFARPEEILHLFASEDLSRMSGYDGKGRHRARLCKKGLVSCGPRGGNRTFTSFSALTLLDGAYMVALHWHIATHALSRMHPLVRLSLESK